MSTPAPRAADIKDGPGGHGAEEDNTEWARVIKSNAIPPRACMGWGFWEVTTQGISVYLIGYDCLSIPQDQAMEWLIIRPDGDLGGRR